jgi:VanZ family protein
MAAIFIASSSSDPSYVPRMLSDTLLHLGIYGLLGAALLHAFADARAERVTRATVLAAIAASLLYGLSDEFHQSFVPGRTPDVMDLVMDVIGASIGAALYGTALKKL